MQNTLIHGDCFQVFPHIPDQSVDLILTDPPFAMTECTWDVSIDLARMFHELNRIIKPNGVIAIFGSQPFTSKVILANEKYFKYNWIWKLFKSPNFMQAKKRPLNNYEDISIFYDKPPVYNPIMKPRTSPRVKEMQNLNWSAVRPRTSITSCKFSKNSNKPPLMLDFSQLDPNQKYPELIIDDIFPVVGTSKEFLGHNTQKSVAIYEYFIKTYTKPNMVVCDPFAGSSTIIESCLNLKRKYIAIELEQKYIHMGLTRLKTYFHNTITIKKTVQPYGTEYLFRKPLDAIMQSNP